MLKHIFSSNFDIYGILDSEYSKGSSQGLVKEFALVMHSKILENELSYKIDYNDAEKEYIAWYFNKMGSGNDI